MRGVVQHKWQMVLIRAMIQDFALVKDQHSIQLGFTSLNRTSIFHLMQNLIPLHDQPFAICVYRQMINFNRCVQQREKISVDQAHIYRCVLAQSVERPPHNREVVGSIPGRVIPKDVKRWELLLPCLAFNI